MQRRFIKKADIALIAVVLCVGAALLLWHTAAIIDAPSRPKGSDFIFVAAHIARVLSTPPARLIKNAVAPRVISAKSALNTVMHIACGSPRVRTVNIVTIFENPGLAPGGRNGREGIRFSRNESAIAWAQRIPKRAVFLAFMGISSRSGRRAASPSPRAL